MLLGEAWDRTPHDASLRHALIVSTLPDGQREAVLARRARCRTLSPTMSSRSTSSGSKAVKIVGPGRPSPRHRVGRARQPRGRAGERTRPTTALARLRGRHGERRHATRRRARGRCGSAAVVAAVTARVRALARRHQRHDRCAQLPAHRAGCRGDVPTVGRRSLTSIAAMLCFNFFFLPPVGHAHDCRPAELDRAARVSRRQPRGEQPVVGGPSARRARRWPGATSWRGCSMSAATSC